MSSPPQLRVDAARLHRRMEALAAIGAIEGGGVCRLALTPADKAARDQVVAWMRELGLRVSIDRIGNIVGLRPGVTAGPPVMSGSHIDTVKTGGRYDGALGVVAALEAVAALNEAGITTYRPLAVGVFTNEEGARFAPDMMGSMVHQGQLELDAMLAVTGIDGTAVGEELRRIGYEGPEPVGALTPHAFVELHVEQGPVLEREGCRIGAVESVQGISWTQIRLDGVSNHAGTTPMAMRRDAGFVAASVAAFVRRLTQEMGGDQVGTVGAIELSPNLVNVIAHRALMTVDLRNTSEAMLRDAELRLNRFVEESAQKEGVRIERRSLARFGPVTFDAAIVTLVEREAQSMGLSVRRLPSGAGHDAQSFAPNCPTGMIFVPSVGGVSHNVTEYTAPEDIVSGANVLLRVLYRLATGEE